MSAGYSGTPLAKKLGVVAGARVALVGEVPSDLHALLDPLPDDVSFSTTPDAATDLVHLFTRDRTTLAASLVAWRPSLRPDAVVWVSWPKKTAKVATDITEHVVRAEALPLGFVDVKVCAVDATWSGLKLVVRKALR